MSACVLVGTSRWRRVSAGGTGGIFRTSLDGSDWEHFPIGEGEAQVNALARVPGRPGHVFACTHYGLFKSENAGETWKNVELPDPAPQLWSITIHPERPETMFVGASPVRVYRTDDGGRTWRSSESSARPERLDFPFHSRVMEIAIDPANPADVYVSMELNGVMRSRDGGENWEDCTEGLLEFPKSAVRYRNKVAVDDDREGILDGHAVCVVPGQAESIIYASRLGLFGSQDGGKKWRDMEIGRFSPLTYARDIKVSPHDPNELAVCLNVYANGTRGSVAKSFDSGKTWQRFDLGPELEGTAIKLAYDPDGVEAFAAVSYCGQVLITLDGGKTFAIRSLPAHAMEGYSVAFV